MSGQVWYTDVFSSSRCPVDGAIYFLVSVKRWWAQSSVGSCTASLPLSLLWHVQVADLEGEREELKKQLEEQRAKCEAIEKRENEKQQLEEKKHNEEIQFLKATNQQLKVMRAVQHM